MEPIFEVKTEENRTLWFEDSFYEFRKKGIKIFHLIFACIIGLSIIFTINSWIKEGEITLSCSDIVVMIVFICTLTYDYLFAFLNSLVLQRHALKNSGLSYIPTSAIFYEEYMEWTFPKKRIVVNYNEIINVRITKNMFVLVRPGSGGRYLISKMGFVVGTPHDFEKFITSKIIHK